MLIASTLFIAEMRNVSLRISLIFFLLFNNMIQIFVSLCPQVMILIGAVKGNGEAFMRLFERLVRGVWAPEAIEFLRPTL